jgi:RNA polymerase sigma-70 factor (ECF subfamily)
MVDESKASELPRTTAASHFETTHWSVVLEARGSSPDSRAALESLCQAYWYPLYAYLRRRGSSIDDAQDLVQAFFVGLIEKRVLSIADPERGRFRSFLLASLRNFTANERDKQQAKKRGGGTLPFRIDGSAGESRYCGEPGHDITPEQLYHKQWAVTLLDRVMELLRDEFSRRGQEHQFECLKRFLAGRSSESSYVEVASELNLTRAAAMSAVSRMRRRYREILRTEIGRTVSHPSEVDDEIRGLFESLGT